MIGAWLAASAINRTCPQEVSQANAGHGPRHRASSKQDQQAAMSEVVMVQENNSFFAYEPILRALQSMRTVPLARVLVPGLLAGAAGGLVAGGWAGGQLDVSTIPTVASLLHLIGWMDACSRQV